MMTQSVTGHLLRSGAMTPDLALALALADEADALTMRHFRASFSVRTKADRTPVTEVDEAVERMIRERLARERPDDGIVGEEFGTAGGGARRWIIDPIDATKNFIRGIPIFATLIALEKSGENEAGVVSAPALGRRWWASRGQGAFCNGAAIHVSDVATIEAAHLGYDDVSGFEQHGLGQAFLALTRRCQRSRGFGDFWTHMLVAEGAIDIAIEPQVALWDLAALQVIVEEAGGRFTDLQGQPRADGGSAISTNGGLHAAVVEAMR
jgi:histidinol-phosphatase